MIENTQPLKMGITDVYPGYTAIYMQHTAYTDVDVQGKMVWVNGTAQTPDVNIDRYYVFAVGLNPGSPYNLEAAYFDAMVDAELRAERFGMAISDPVATATRAEPTINSYTITAEEVDVGVAPPVLTLDLDGDADLIEAQWAPTGTSNWTGFFYGGFLQTLGVAGLPIGVAIDVRIRGVVNFPDGSTRDVSSWDTLENITLNWGFTPPEKVSNITFQVAKLKEPAERYDVKISWDWEKLDGANAREFVVWRLDKAKYDSNNASDKWAGAEVINAGTAKSVVVTNHPFDREQVYRVATTAWGPESDDVVYADNIIFKIDDTTTIDNSFTNETGIDLTYSHIRGRVWDDTNSVWKQSFNVDAATGNVTIGILDEEGEAPISFTSDGNGNGTVNVKGSVISETINAANFVLTNLNGTQSPQLRSAGKTEYGDSTEGIWMGHEMSGGYRFKFDLGNSAQYIRWDGDTLRISGDVAIGTPQGDRPLYSQVRTIYKAASSTPATPTQTTYPPSGWTVAPPTVPSGQYLYISVGLVDLTTSFLVDGESWSAPALTGGTGAPGQDGTDGTDGADGPGFYSQAISGFNGTFQSSTATSFFQSQFGRPPAKYDVLTQYNPSNPSIATTRQWDTASSGAWGTVALAVHGNMVVDGSLTADALIANTILGTNLHIGNTGGDGVYAGIRGSHTFGSSLAFAAGYTSTTDNTLPNWKWGVTSNGIMYARNSAGSTRVELNPVTDKFSFRGDITAETLTLTGDIPDSIDNSNVTTSSIGAETPSGAQAKADAAKNSAISTAASDATAKANAAEAAANGYTENRIYPNQTSTVIKSANYSQGSDGFSMDINGNAEFNNVVVRGTGYFTDGVFDGTVYAEKIVGDIVSGLVKSNPPSSQSRPGGTTGWIDLSTVVTVSHARPYPRRIQLASAEGYDAIQFMAEVERNVGFILTFQLISSNGTVVWTSSQSFSAIGSSDDNLVTVSFPSVNGYIPANTPAGSYKFRITSNHEIYHAWYMYRSLGTARYPITSQLVAYLFKDSGELS
ncbi:tail protein [Vibrio phage vB_ValS_X1]|uniref:Tail protein n=1 Tax=Vibrio phage vB_ValS_X1 TaxID=2736341 RepID=A0A6M9Z6H0_9CAUD|nr:tail protein [Vibrio phage vB_ValS_X1]